MTRQNQNLLVDSQWWLLVLRHYFLKISVLNNKGVTHSNLGQFKEAIEYFERIVDDVYDEAHDPDNADVWYNKGLAHYGLAQVFLRDRSKRNPENNDRLVRSAIAENEQAIFCCEKVLEEDSKKILIRSTFYQTDAKRLINMIACEMPEFFYHYNPNLYDYSLREWSTF